MLKKSGYSLTVVGALLFTAGVVNSAFVSSVIAEDEDKDKEERSGELMADTLKSAFADVIMAEDEDKDKKGKSGELI